MGVNIGENEAMGRESRKERRKEDREGKSEMTKRKRGDRWQENTGEREGTGEKGEI